MTGPADWISGPDEDPTAAEALHECLTPDCADCDVTTKIADAGASALAKSAGVPYEALPEEHRRHYRAIASEVMAAMSEAMIDLGLAHPKEST